MLQNALCIVPAALLAVFASSARAEWAAYTSKNFTLYSDAPQSEVIEMLRDFEEYRRVALAADLLGGRRGGRVEHVIAGGLEHIANQLAHALLVLDEQHAGHVRRRLRIHARCLGDRLWPLVEQARPAVLLLDGRALIDIEYTALKMLIDAEARLQRGGVTLWLASLNPQVLQMVQQSPLGRTLGRERMFFNVQAAVQHYEQIAASRPSVVDRV